MTDNNEDADLEELASTGDVAAEPNEAADPWPLLEASIPADILRRYEVHSYRGAAVLLSQAHRREFDELCKALRDFSISTPMIRMAGGNESDIPKLLTSTLRPLGWRETLIRGDLIVHLIAKLNTGKRKKGEPALETRELRRERYLDGHKIDYVKGRVAFDLEWNSKDQTFDRDLYAFSAFAQCGVIDVGVLLTRSRELDPVFRALGSSLKRDGTAELKNGKPRLVHEKYGASTTHMGKLIYRLNAGRNGGCPVLVLGITPRCIIDWPITEDGQKLLLNETGTS